MVLSLLAIPRTIKRAIMMMAIIPTNMIHPDAPRVSLTKSKPPVSVALPRRSFNVPTATAAATIAPTANACIKEAERKITIYSLFEAEELESTYNNETPHNEPRNTL